MAFRRCPIANIGSADTGTSLVRSAADRKPAEKKEYAPRGQPPTAPKTFNMPGFREVVRCRGCGNELTVASAWSRRGPVHRCGADLHSCAQCVNFDTGAALECQQPIPARVSPKDTRNTCTFFEPRTTVERETKSGAARERAQGVRRSLQVRREDRRPQSPWRFRALLSCQPRPETSARASRAPGQRLPRRACLSPRSAGVHAGARLSRRRALRGHRTERPLDRSARSSSRTARCCRSRKIDREYFGEGIAVVDDTIYRADVAVRHRFLYDRETFRRNGYVHVSRRGLGAHARRPAADHERRHRVPALSRSGDAEGDLSRMQVKDGRRRSSS